MSGGCFLLKYNELGCDLWQICRCKKIRQMQNSKCTRDFPCHGSEFTNFIADQALAGTRMYRQNFFLHDGIGCDTFHKMPRL
jgi:hypothetical protein